MIVLVRFAEEKEDDEFQAMISCTKARALREELRTVAELG